MRSPVISAARKRVAWIVLAIAALLAVLPLIGHGCSCGHDFDFHIQSWLDAAQQMRHGTLDPQWANSAAWNAGEPRFVFYPPLSWMLGAILTLLLPIAATPALFTWIALALAAMTMFHCAREFAPPRAALLVAALYAVNPYMLFTAFERTAYAELLAAAWMPLVVLAALRPRSSMRSIVAPIALLWLTNAPAAVIGTYAFVLLFVLRLVLTNAGRARGRRPARAILGEIGAAGAGLALGLALPAFYLLPAALERRYVQIAMAILPNMRVEDNFLFGHTGDATHDAVLHTASVIAIVLLAAAAISIVAAIVVARKNSDASTFDRPRANRDAFLLAAVLVAVAVMLTPASLLLWHRLPELRFLQFPWRLLSLLGVVAAIALALALRSVPMRAAVSITLALALAATLSVFAIRVFRQGCDASDLPATRAQLFATHHGVAPTDEYTPARADNDALSPNDPGFWLSGDPNAPAPGAIVNPTTANAQFDPADLTDAQTLSGYAPHHLDLHLAAPANLVLNLRNYPSWQIARNGTHIDAEPVRDDGLIAVPLPAGSSSIDVTWHSGRDRLAGDILSLLALLLFVFGPRFQAARAD